MRNCRRWTNEEDTFLIENAKTMSAREIGEKLDRTVGSIRKRYPILNITDLKNNESTKRYSYNKDFFENIDTENKSYWLGMIASDGCIIDRGNGGFRLKITLKVDDKSHLEKFAKDLDSNLVVREKKIKYNEKDYMTAELMVNSTKMCKDLIALGIGVNKTFNMSMPNISEDLKKHFIRGFVDGDGSLYLGKRNCGRYIYSLEIVGYKCEIMEEINEYFINNNIHSNIYYKRKNNDKLGIYAKESLKKALNLLYTGSNVYLERKFEKCNEILTLFNNVPSLDGNAEL